MSAIRTTNAAIICAVLLIIAGTQGASAQMPDELRAGQYHVGC
jgi:hypothetical protein